MGLEPDRIGIHVHNTHSSQSNFQDTVCLQYPISYTHQCIYMCVFGWVGGACVQFDGVIVSDLYPFVCLWKKTGKRISLCIFWYPQSHVSMSLYFINIQWTNWDHWKSIRNRSTGIDWHSQKYSVEIDIRGHKKINSCNYLIGIFFSIFFNMW